jgi:hypothetical protein
VPEVAGDEQATRVIACPAAAPDAKVAGWSVRPWPWPT